MVTLRTAALTLAISLGGVTSGIPTLAEDRTSFDVSVGYAPPPLPTYYQPPCPGYGYLWTPGYWGWDDYNQDYFWVPGT